MKFLYNIVILFFITTFFSCKIQKGTIKLDNELNAIYKKSNFPGFAISIIKDDATLFAKGYGYANISKKIPYTIETIQPIGSVSKTFIALALMKSVELGYFTLDDNINDLLPFKIINPNFPNAKITVGQLATHTSSLIDNDTTRYKTYSLGSKPIMELGDFLKEYYIPTGKYYSIQNFSNNLVGTNYSYSNIASALVAYIIEVKSNMSFSDFTNKYIFEPLQMKNTSWFYDANIKDKNATLYQILKPENPLYYQLMNADNTLKTYCNITYPDGSLHASINELSKYLKKMILGYFNKEVSIVNYTSYQTLFEKKFTENNMPSNMDSKEPNRAMFWSYNKKGEIRHTGSSAGVFSFISFNPYTGVGKIMTMNASLEGDENVQTVEAFLKIISAINHFENNLKN